MKIFFTILIICGPFAGVFGQTLNGLWKGSFHANGTTIGQGRPTYVELSIDQTGVVVGKLRSEIYNAADFAIKNIKGTQKEQTITLSEIVISKKALASKTNWCRMKMELTYNQKSGFLEGTYTSSECKNNSGKVVLYQEDGTFPSEITNPESHFWFDQLSKDIAKGLHAPKIRKYERDHFVFSPIFFDYDKSEVKPAFNSVLDELIYVVEGHSDLRVLVIGHTDSDGSDAYNDDLSKRRAQAIIDYFVSKGLSADRLEFDFKGEKLPVESNQTPEGRQKNRRVDFKFI